MSIAPCLRPIVLWQIRAAFKFNCWLAIAVGELMARFASAFKCGRTRPRYGGAVFAAQFALLLAWTPTRLLFLVLERAAMRTYRTHALVNSRWA